MVTDIQYEGDGPAPPKGPMCAIHPERGSVGACQHCGTFSCGDCLGWLGTKRVCATCVREGRVTVYGIPWDQRTRVGTFRAWRQTAGQIYSQPIDFYNRLDPHGSLGEAVLFALISGLWLGLAYLALVGVIGLLVGVAMIFGGGGGGIGAAEVSVVAIIGAIYVILPPVMLVIGGFIAGLIHHVTMLLLGGGTAGLGASVRVVLFSSCIQMFQFVPCLNYVAWAWYLPVQGIGYTQVHKQDGWRSALGIVIPICGCCLCYIGFYVFIIAAAEM